MLQVDLSALSGTELRQLLDSTRQRGQADLTYRILQEMADRRERRAREGGPRKLFRGRRDAEPRPITLDLGDPLEPKDEPDPLPAWEPDPDEPPLTLALEPEPEPDPRRAPPPYRGRPKRSPWIVAGFAAGIFVGAALGVGVNEITSAEPPRAEPAVPTNIAAAAPAQLQIATAPAPAEPLAVLDTPAEHPPEPPPTEAAEAEVPSPDAADAPTEAAEPAPVELAEAEPPPVAKGCAAKATPADQVICATPRLQRLQVELRQAYAEALDAHEDRALLRERQLAWRDARSEVSDPIRLARLYEQRIRKLHAATAEARGDR